MFIALLRNFSFGNGWRAIVPVDTVLIKHCYSFSAKLVTTNVHAIFHPYHFNYFVRDNSCYCCFNSYCDTLKIELLYAVENFKYAIPYFWDIGVSTNAITFWCLWALNAKKSLNTYKDIKEWSCMKPNSPLLGLSCQTTKLDEGYAANNMVLIRLFFAWSRSSSALVYWRISFFMPIKCNFFTSSFFSVEVEVDILEWYLGLKRSTYALENGSSTIAANLLCQCCNVGRLLPMHLPLLLSQVLSLPLTVNPTVSVVKPVAANTAFQLATVLATNIHVLMSPLLETSSYQTIFC